MQLIIAYQPIGALAHKDAKKGQRDIATITNSL
jgi:hypothetical protein